MRVLVVGAGGREHALAWRLSSSPQVTEILTAPGNSGTAGLGENLPIADTDLDGILAAAQSRAAGLVVVGPEIPLAMGLADRLNAAGIPAFGPSQAAAQLEASKSFARDVMAAAGVPGPHYRVFQSTSGALEYIATHDRPVVVKADGLAAGKGVAMCASRAGGASGRSRLHERPGFRSVGRHRSDRGLDRRPGSQRVWIHRRR